MTIESDENLLLAIQKGSRSAFSELVRRHNEKFYYLAYRYMVNQAEAEDVTQAAFLKLWENPSIYKSGKGAKFTTWFYRIIVNLCLDKRKKHSPVSMPEGFDIKDNSHNQEDGMVLNEKKHLLEQVLTTLPDRQKTALILCFYEGISHKEAAEIMKINIQALQSLLMRGKTTLKEKMKVYI